MNVLLTGGAGYIGIHTAVELLNGGHSIVVADNFCNSSPEALARARELTGKDFPQYDVDVCDKARFRRVFAEQHIDAVIHFAGLKAVGESVEQPLAYYRNNLDATLTTLELMKEFGVRKMVFSSSATVYGENEQDRLDEDQPVKCNSPYGWTKAMIEQILRDVAHAEPEDGIVLLRYFNPVGAHESGRIGEDPNGIPNNLFPRVMQSATGKLQHLGIYGDDYPTPDGTCIRDYIHVVDLAKGHIAALRYLQNGFRGAEAINLGTGTGYSVREILDAFETVNHVKLDYDVQPRRPGDISVCRADVRKAARLLNWKSEKTLEDMCRDGWNWQQKNPNGYRD